MTNHLKQIMRAINNNIPATQAIVIGILLGMMVGMIITGNMAQRHIQRVKDRHMAEPSIECVTLPFDAVAVQVLVDIEQEPLIITGRIEKECR